MNLEWMFIILYANTEKNIVYILEVPWSKTILNNFQKLIMSSKSSDPLDSSLISCAISLVIPDPIVSSVSPSIGVVLIKHNCINK